MKIGVISDTHGLLRPEALKALTGVVHILHAGDIGKPGIIETLETLAPVTAIRGNVDKGGWAAAWPEEQLVELGGRRIFMLHDLKSLRADPAAHGFDVVIHGHSHKAEIREVDGVLYLNPGSAGPRRFKLPVTLATLDLACTSVRACIEDLLPS